MPSVGCRWASSPTPISAWKSVTSNQKLSHPNCSLHMVFATKSRATCSQTHCFAVFETVLFDGFTSSFGRFYRIVESFNNLPLIASLRLYKKGEMLSDLFEYRDVPTSEGFIQRQAKPNDTINVLLTTERPERTTGLKFLGIPKIGIWNQKSDTRTP